MPGPSENNFGLEPENPISLHIRAVVSERGGGAAGVTLAPTEFRSFVNPIPNRGGRLCPPHYC